MRSGVSVFADLEDLPAAAEALFRPVGQGDFFATRAWYEVVRAAAMPPGTRTCFALAPCGQALLPMRVDTARRDLGSLTTPYTCLFAPLLMAECSSEALRTAGRAFGRFFKNWSTIRLDALSEESSGSAALLRGVAEAGLLPVSFAHFGNWIVPVAGLGWTDYLSQRSGALRETVRRKLRRTEQGRDVRFELIEAEADIERGIAAYESVYARSWKEPEPFPNFNAQLMRTAARHKVLRLGLLYVSDLPVAGQLWIVSGGTASVLKLAHDEAAKALSPGTVLTATMIRHFLDVERPKELDFGRGDDPYKQLWTTQRRQRVGVVFANPWRPAGAAFLARHSVGRLLRRVRFRR